MFEFRFSIPAVMSIATFESLPTLADMPEAVIGGHIFRTIIARDGRNLWHAVQRCAIGIAQADGDCSDPDGGADLDRFEFVASPILILAYAIEPD